MPANCFAFVDFPEPGTPLIKINTLSASYFSITSLINPKIYLLLTSFNLNNKCNNYFNFKFEINITNAISFSLQPQSLVTY